GREITNPQVGGLQYPADPRPVDNCGSLWITTAQGRARPVNLPDRTRYGRHLSYGFAPPTNPSGAAIDPGGSLDDQWPGTGPGRTGGGGRVLVTVFAVVLVFGALFGYRGELPGLARPGAEVAVAPANPV